MAMTLYSLERSTFKQGQAVDVDGSIGIVLDNGMSGRAFNDTYYNKLIQWYS